MRTLAAELRLGGVRGRLGPGFPEGRPEQEKGRCQEQQDQRDGCRPPFCHRGILFAGPGKRVSRARFKPFKKAHPALKANLMFHLPYARKVLQTGNDFTGGVLDLPQIWEMWFTFGRLMDTSAFLFVDDCTRSEMRITRNPFRAIQRVCEGVRNITDGF